MYLCDDGVLCRGLGDDMEASSKKLICETTECWKLALWAVQGGSYFFFCCQRVDRLGTAFIEPIYIYVT